MFAKLTQCFFGCIEIVALQRKVNLFQGYTNRRGLLGRCRANMHLFIIATESSLLNKWTVSSFGLRYVDGQDFGLWLAYLIQLRMK